MHFSAKLSKAVGRNGEALVTCRVVADYAALIRPTGSNGGLSCRLRRKNVNEKDAEEPATVRHPVIL